MVSQLISLIFGRHFHIFKPRQVAADDPEIAAHVLVEQTRYFGPFPLSYETLLDDEQEKAVAAIHIYIEQQGLRKPFAQMEDREMTADDKKFLCDVLQIDPRDRPTAKALLTHDWFNTAY